MRKMLAGLALVLCVAQCVSAYAGGRRVRQVPLVTGARIGRYVGQRVEISGISDNSKFKVKGGLWPPANVAGQAGAINPARAAMAAQPGGPSSATGEVDLPKVTVKSVRALDARCR